MTNAKLYRGYPPRNLSGGRLHHGIALEMPPIANAMRERLDAAFAQPFVGLTTDGKPREGLYPLRSTGADTSAAVSAARAFLAGIRRDDHRKLVQQAFDGADRRRWTNAFPHWAPHGVLLADFEPTNRDALLALVAATLSARGFADTRRIMRANQALGEFLNHSTDTLCEYGFFFTLYGEPAVDGAWGWRLMGNHLVVHATFVRDQLNLTPAFWGTEMSVIDAGPYAGQQLFVEEQRLGLELATSLSASQRATAILHPSMLSQDLPKHLTGPDGRHLGGAGQDNRVITPEGIAANSLSPGQRSVLTSLLEVYLGRAAEPHGAAALHAALAHLDETRFAWIGNPEQRPFYYRIHGPTVWIEFDHHSGVFLSNPEPEPFHIHTIVRTPNGNDYGADLLRQHYAQHPHPHVHR